MVRETSTRTDSHKGRLTLVLENIVQAMSRLTVFTYPLYYRSHILLSMHFTWNIQDLSPLGSFRSRRK